MKFLTALLFLTTLCFAQNKPKLIAYRLVNTVDDGPCSVEYYTGEEFESDVFTCESDDTEFIVTLLKLRNQAIKKWQKSSFYCKGYQSIDMIYNMYIIKNVKNTDTIFTTKNNDFIVFPKDNAAYKDPDLLLQTALTEDLKAFFTRDFETEMFRPEITAADSIALNKIIYKQEALTERFFENTFSKAVTIKKNPEGYSSTKERFVLIEESTRTKKDEEISKKELVIEKNGIIADGIKIGDDEEEVLKKYPNSSKYQCPLSTRFEEIKNNYVYTLKIISDSIKPTTCFLYFEIENKKIIAASFYYVN